MHYLTHNFKTWYELPLDRDKWSHLSSHPFLSVSNLHSSNATTKIAFGLIDFRFWWLNGSASASRSKRDGCARARARARSPKTGLKFFYWPIGFPLTSGSTFVKTIFARAHARTCARDPKTSQKKFLPEIVWFAKKTQKIFFAPRPLHRHLVNFTPTPKFF